MKNKFLLLASIGLLGVAAFGFQNPKATYAISQDWSIPSDVKIVDETVLNSIIDPRADGETFKDNTQSAVFKRETYQPKDRQWEGLVTCAATGNRLWAAFYTGGTREPDEFNYIAVAYSDDDGKNWVDPYIVIDNKDANRIGVRAILPNFYMEDNVLVLQFMQQYIFEIRFTNPGAQNIRDVQISEPQKVSDLKLHKAPTFVTDRDGSKIKVVAYETKVDNTEQIGTTYIDYFDKTQNKYVRRGKAVSSNASARLYPESQVVELEKGKWMVVSRLENGQNGGIECAISNDYGYTWEAYKSDLGEPFIGPGSKGHIMQLSSGHILVINHDTSSARSSLCAYLSTDNGKSYPYKLSIDSRPDVSYPYAFEKDGYIYVAWDKGRYLEKEFRISKITEQDIIDGEVSSSGSFEKRIINKLNGEFTDIVSTNNSFEKTITVTKGTQSADIKKNLPTTISVKDSNNKEYILNGVWKSSGYKPDIVGTYYFTFNATFDSTLQDTYNLLRVKIVVTEKEEKQGFLQKLGCKGSVVGGSVVISLVSLGAGALLLKKKKRK